MKIVATADLHINHPRSRGLAEDLIRQINTMTLDVLLVVGDTATSEGDELERCLSLCTHPGPRLFVAGNHELWSRRDDTHRLFMEELPRRVRSAGWHWLEGDPFQVNHVAFVGTIGWYDYSFAPTHLEIPFRFYRAKVSPGAAAHLPEHSALLAAQDDLLPHHLEVIARWNDGKFVRLQRDDEQFLHERLAELETSLQKVAHARQVIAAVHHLPFRDMLPPRHTPSWDFAWAYLGSHRIGELLLRYPNVSHVLCGHTHMADQRQINHLQVTNIGSGYRQKRLVLLEV